MRRDSPARWSRRPRRSRTFRRVNAGSDVTVFPAQMYALNATWSDPGPNDGPWTYTIAWGDGVSEGGTKTDQSAVTGSHGYGTPGTYTVTSPSRTSLAPAVAGDVHVTSSTTPFSSAPRTSPRATTTTTRPRRSCSMRSPGRSSRSATTRSRTGRLPTTRIAISRRGAA